jgi:hypothetical protein
MHMASHNLIEINPLPKADVLDLINPETGENYANADLLPFEEHAIRMYSTGQCVTKTEGAALAKTTIPKFNKLLNSVQGQKIVDSVKSELEFEYGRLFKQFIEVVAAAMQHPEPSVALAGAKLFASTQIGTKHKVELSAEDIVQQIISGQYSKEY